MSSYSTTLTAMAEAVDKRWSFVQNAWQA